MILTSLVCAVCVGWIDESLLTVAEKSGYRATATHAEVVSLLDRLAGDSAYARRGSLGKSVEGRELPLLFLADPPVATAAEARALAEKEQRVIVFMIGNIHAGEVDGKEALPMLAREILAAEKPRLLRRLIVAMVPIYNADGNERVATTNRPGQEGPELGMGQRHNANDRDLNRDGVKIEEPETQALVRFLNECDPHIFVDTHTTNGSRHRFLITYAGAKVPAGDPEIIRTTREEMFPAIADCTTKSNGTHTMWYGTFAGSYGEASIDRTRWETFPAEARYLTNYVGLRNRYSILSEAYAYASYKERVQGTRDFCRCVLEWAAGNVQEIRRRTREGDERAIAKGNRTDDHAEDFVTIRTRTAARAEPVTILGYDEELRDGKLIASTKPKAFEGVRLMDEFEREHAVVRPWAYVLPVGSEEIVRTLRRHGIRVERLMENRRLSVDRLTVTGVRAASREFQGHTLVRIEVDGESVERDYGPGAFVVRTGQALGHLAVYLLEPESEDGLGTWNAYDPWLRVGEELPTARLMREEKLDVEELP